uniref:Venom protein n=1 Tax=Ampulex compressa TaxID=860918 RepID=A0A1W6EVR6_AMPCP|nr:venom protein [Ampulex compressa]
MNAEKVVSTLYSIWLKLRSGSVMKPSVLLLAMAVAILASTASKTGAAYGSPLPEANAEPEPFAPLARSVVRLLKAMSRGLHRLSQRPATQIGMEMVNER